MNLNFTINLNLDLTESYTDPNLDFSSYTFYFRDAGQQLRNAIAEHLF